MSSESLVKAGLFFDDLNKIRVWEPDAAQKTSDLKNECKDFVDRISDFHTTADDFIKLVNQLAEQVEEEKTRALGSSNLLKSMSKQREAQQQQYQSLIIDKSNELERLRQQYQSLLKVEAEQQNTIEQLQMS